MKLKPCSMQEVTFGRQPCQTPSAAAAVGVISDHWVAHRREMHPDLVRPTGKEMRAQQISAGEAGEAAKIRPGLLTSTDDCHTLPVSWVARDWLVHRESIGSEVPPRHGSVAPSDPPGGDSGAEPAVRNLGFGDYQQAGGFLIQPVNQASSLRATPLREFFAPANEGVDQGPAPVTRRRMDNHARDLVDDQQVGVLEDDQEGNLLALHLTVVRHRLRVGDCNEVRCGCTI